MTNEIDDKFIFLQNICFGTTKEELLYHFKDCGKVKNIISNDN